MHRNALAHRCPAKMAFMYRKSAHCSAYLNFGTLTVAIGAALLALALAEENLGFGRFDLGTVFIAG
jgi:hypothetical protein